MLIRINGWIFYRCVFAVHGSMNTAITCINAGIFKIPTAVTTLYLEIDLYGIGLTTDEISVGTGLNTHLSVVTLLIPTKSYDLICHMVLRLNGSKAEIYGFTCAWLGKCQLNLAHRISRGDCKCCNRHHRKHHNQTDHQCYKSFCFHFFSFFCLHGNCRIGVACA